MIKLKDNPFYLNTPTDKEINNIIANIDTVLNCLDWLEKEEAKNDL